MKLERCITYAKVPTRKLVFYILIIAGLHIQSSCSFQNIAPDQFPDTDIIFQTETLWGERSDETLGFVNADGSILTYLSILIPNKWGGKSSPCYPTIASDGSTLVFRIPSATGTAGELVVMHPSQRAIICNVEMGGGRPSLTGDQNLALIHLVSPGGRLALFNLANCEEGMDPQSIKIYDMTTIQHSPRGGALSPNSQTLAFEEFGNYQDSEETPPLPTIYVQDLASGLEITIGNGFAPAWSPDGQWIAFTGVDGIYLVKADGTDKRRVVEYQSPEGGGRPPFEEDWPPLPSWSPDGNWLVYHKCTLEPGLRTNCNAREDYAIFKVNIETGEEIKILDGGLNPYWRWKKDRS